MQAQTWEDVRIEDKILVVNKCSKISKYRDGKENKRKTTVSATKTISGNRNISLNNTAIEYFTRLYDFKVQQNIRSDCVAYTLKGNMSTAKNLQRTFDLVVSKLMGHANTAITMETYIHVFEESKMKAMQLLDVN